MKKAVLLFLPLFLGCSIGKLVLRVDPSLKTGADVYEVDYPGLFSNKPYSMAFGDYRVTGTGKGVVTHSTGFGGDLFLFDELFGFESPDVKSMHKSGSYRYQFHKGEATWEAHCIFAMRTRELKGKTLTMREHHSLNYACKYTSSGQKPWVLKVTMPTSEYYLTVRLRGRGQSFHAIGAQGDAVYSDGRVVESSLSSYETGYIWKANQKSIGAVSVQATDPQQVWLGRQNSAELNDALAMASTGLLLYYREIKSALER